MKLPKGWKQLSDTAIRNDNTETTIEIIGDHETGIASVVLYKEAKLSDAIHKRIDNEHGQSSKDAAHSCQL